MVIKQLAKQLTFVFIFYSIPLCPMFFLFKIHSFKEINLLEKCALITVCSNNLELKMASLVDLGWAGGGDSLKFLRDVTD